MNEGGLVIKEPRASWTLLSRLESQQRGKSRWCASLFKKFMLETESLTTNSTKEKSQRQRTSSNSFAVARLLTSTQRQTAKNPLSSLLNASGFFNVGVPFVAIKYNAFRGSSSRYGGSFSIISIAMIPKDQMSTFAPYSFCLTTSGAIQ